MELNVKNIPLDVYFKFDDNKYVFAHISSKSIGGIPIKSPLILTYVFELDDDKLVNIISGRIVDKKVPYDIHKEFMIVDYDTEDAHEYSITMPLREATVEEIYKISNALMEWDKNKRNIK